MCLVKYEPLYTKKIFMSTLGINDPKVLSSFSGEYAECHLDDGQINVILEGYL